MEGQGIKYWCWIYTWAACFLWAMQHLLVCEDKVNQVLSFMVEKQSFFSPKLGKYPSHTTEAPTATQLLSFLSFLEVVERTGYS